jgi:hypothetical protein
VRTSFLLTVIALALLLPATWACAQDDDGWGEIAGLMNGLTAAQSQLASSGVNLSAGGAGGLSPGFVDGLTRWCQAYARLLESVDGAFSTDGATWGAAGGEDPFSGTGTDPLTAELNRWQAAMQGQAAVQGRAAARGQAATGYSLGSTYQAPANYQLPAGYRLPAGYKWLNGYVVPNAYQGTTALQNTTRYPTATRYPTTTQYRTYR